MKLSELAAAAGTTTASVKFYIRSGLLAPGVRKNRTTAVYSREHLERLELILGVRRRIGAPLRAVQALTGVIDDPGAGLLDVMEAAQTLAVGGDPLPAAGSAGDGKAAVGGEAAIEDEDEDEDEGTGRGEGMDGGEETAGAPTAEAHATLAAVIDTRGWPDAGSAARDSVERRMALAAARGLVWDAGTLNSVAAAVERIGTLGMDVGGSRDVVALKVAVGTYELSQLVVDMLRLAQTSESIRRVRERQNRMPAVSDAVSGVH